MDWGGTGETMVLLTGLGDNAHVFSQFAFQWTDHFHVIGITRRGYLPSSQPPDGYDVPTRVADDIAVLDALSIDRVVLVGHSISGSELSALAATHPERVDKVVYLDAQDLPRRNEVPGPPAFLDLFTDADTKSLWAYQAANARYQGVREYDPAVCPGLQFNDMGVPVTSTTPAAVPAAILAGVAAVPPVDWSCIAAPRLGIFAQPTIEGTSNRGIRISVRLIRHCSMNSIRRMLIGIRRGCASSRGVIRSPLLSSKMLRTTYTSTTRRTWYGRCGLSWEYPDDTIYTPSRDCV
jgi:pimeloyl-ACP methyl ester carboxylesterase